MSTTETERSALATTVAPVPEHPPQQHPPLRHQHVTPCRARPRPTVVAKRSVAQRAAKRTFDVATALFLIVVLSPLLLLIAAVVYASSPGGAIFTQWRVGRRGELFRIYKFRTMAAGTFDQVMNSPELRAAYEANGFKLDNDDCHVTRLGRLLRKASLDELPQLFNVVVGDMSLVGVRPLVACELQARSRLDQMLYRSARPGLTGLWQVTGRSSIGGDQRIKLDRRYLVTWTLRTDIKIMLLTPFALCRLRCVE